MCLILKSSENFVYVFSFYNTHYGRPYKRTKIQCKERLFLYRKYHDDMHISVQGNYNNWLILIVPKHVDYKL